MDLMDAHLLTHKVTAHEKQIELVGSILERLQLEAEATSAFASEEGFDDFPDDIADADSDSEEEDLGHQVPESDEDDVGDEAIDAVGGCKRFAMGGFQAIMAAKVAKAAQNPKQLKIVFLSAAGLQVILFLLLLVVQQAIKDEGVFLVLLLICAVLMGLQTGQCLDYFKDSNGNTRRRDNLLYKQTKLMAFHSKMLFYPLLIMDIVSAIFFCCVYSIVLYYRDCTSYTTGLELNTLSDAANTCEWGNDGTCDDGSDGNYPPYCVDGTDTADCGVIEESLGGKTLAVFGLDSMHDSFAWSMIITMFVIFVPLMLLLASLSLLHFGTWSRLADKWQRSRLLFASFEIKRRLTQSRPSNMFDPLKSSGGNLDADDSVTFLVVALGAFAFQLAQLVTFWIAREDHREQTVIYTVVVFTTVMVGFQLALMQRYYRQKKDVTHTLDGVEQIKRWHGRQLFYPAIVSTISSVCYISCIFASMHYYRELEGAGQVEGHHGPGVHVALTGGCAKNVGLCASCQLSTLSLPEGVLSDCGTWTMHGSNCTVQCPHGKATKGRHPTCWNGEWLSSVACLDYTCPQSLFDGVQNMDAAGRWWTGCATVWCAGLNAMLALLFALHLRKYTAAVQRVSEWNSKTE